LEKGEEVGTATVRGAEEVRDEVRLRVGWVRVVTGGNKTSGEINKINEPSDKQ
jgi:hypothetical protein